MPRVLSICVILAGAVTLFGTVMGWEALSGWLPHFRPMTGGSALAFILAGTSLLVWTLRPSMHLRLRLAQGLAIGVLAITLPALGYLLYDTLRNGPEALSTISTGLHAHRKAPFTMVALLLYGVALLIPRQMLPHRWRPAELLALGGVLLGFVMALASLYRVSFGASPAKTMASSFPASLLMILLGAAIISSHPKGMIGTLFGNRGIAGYLTRRIFLLLLISPPTLGALRMLGQQRGWYDPPLGAALSIGAYVFIFGSVILAFGYKLYIAEKRRRAVERRLVSREFDARVAFNNAPVGIGQLNRNYRWVRINRQLSEIFGYSHDEFTTVPLKELVMPDHREGCASQLRALMAGEITQYTQECLFRRKGGDRIWCNMTIIMPADTRLGRRYAIVVMEDVTERKRVELEIVRQKAAAEAANRAKDRFISVISHELRTPLTPVLATLTAYPTETLTEEQQRVLAMMRRNIEHEVSLIDDLLEVTRFSHGKLRLKKIPVNLHKLLTELFETLTNSLREKKLTGHLELKAEHYNVLGDRARLRQIFLNLLDNAKKFTPPGGQIVVSTFQGENRQIVTEIRDTGAGISRPAIERIFEAFEQGDESRTRQQGGLGLGLAICKGLVEGHHGVIGVTSEGRGKGSVFSVTLDTIEQPEAERPSAPAPKGRSATILLVEDHTDTRVTLKMLLERRGHRVLEAANMAEALSVAGAHGPDLLLSDIGLPDGDGLELKRMIRESCGVNLPAIALSGFAGDDDRSASARAGYVRHLIKPVDIQMLDEAIREVLMGV